MSEPSVAVVDQLVSHARQLTLRMKHGPEREKERERVRESKRERERERERVREKLAGTGAMAEVVHNRAGSRSTTLRGLGYERQEHGTRRTRRTA